MIALAYGIIVVAVALIATLITAIVVDTVRRIRLTRRIDEAFQKTRRLFTWPWCLKLNDDGTIENEVQDTIEDHDRCFTSNEILARIAISPLNHIEGIERSHCVIGRGLVPLCNSQHYTKIGKSVSCLCITITN
jgi:hypothetical protein